MISSNNSQQIGSSSSKSINKSIQIEAKSKSYGLQIKAEKVLNIEPLPSLPKQPNIKI